MSRDERKVHGFAKRYGLIVVDGEIGMGQPCVGFIKDDDESRFLAHNPIVEYRHYELYPEEPDNLRQEWEPSIALECQEMVPPASVNDYGKGDYVAVIHDGVAGLAIRGLAIWCDAIERAGHVKVVKWEHGMSNSIFTKSESEWAMVCGDTGRRIGDQKVFHREAEQVQREFFLRDVEKSRVEFCQGMKVSSS